MMNMQVTEGGNLNQTILVGTITEKPNFSETSNGNTYATVIMDVKRAYQNPEGVYESDQFQVTLWKNLAEDFKEKLKKGMMIGVKGRLAANNYLNDGKVRYRCDIFAEKVTLLETN